ncbi:MAG: hypothetical protein DMD33_09255 [Gemmatimonadetes bacterium]|nr:MAG: hypothetical protein DMD33_09255 [Gemmatimonadota bacterium]
MLRKTRIAALCAILLTPLAISGPAGNRTQSAAQPAPSYTYRGTVHAVNASTGTLDLITGVGMSLRLVHLSAGPAVHTSAPTAGLRMADVKPGDIVTVECHRTSAGLVVDRIEKLEAPAR